VLKLVLYAGESEVKSTASEVTTPCQPNPCDHGQVCQVNRHKCADGSRCKPHICRPGCRVGDMSAVVVPTDSYVRLPAPGHENCHHVCRCGHHRLLQRCSDFGCLSRDDCILSAGRIQCTYNLRYLCCVGNVSILFDRFVFSMLLFLV
jgi:reversion-inducing cysteine-rich kazal motif protein